MLIVEDDDARARLGAETLSQAGYDVRVEPTPAGAREAFRTRQPDLVVLGVRLPHDTGFELAEELRRLPGADRVPLLFISGSDEPAGHRADAIARLGAVEFIEKPLAPAELLAHVRAALAGRAPAGAAADAASETVDQHAERILSADESFRAGRLALGHDRPQEAVSALARAVALYPEEALFHAYLGLATHLARPDDRAAAEDALAHLARAAGLHPTLPELRQFESLVRLALPRPAG